MAMDWHSALLQRLSGEDEEISPSPDGKVHVWSSLMDSIQITSYRPEANPNVINSKLSSRSGDYYVLKNAVEKTYLRLSPAEYDMWKMMDGKTNVHDLIVEYYLKTGSFAHNIVIRLVQQLYQHHMLCEKPVSVWNRVSAQIHSRSWLYRASAPARAILTQRLSINGIDHWIGKLYKLIGWLFYNPVVVVLFTLISIFGFVAYTRVVSDPRYVFLGDNFVVGLATLWVLSIIPVIIHELGHALTVKHYGREVPRGGLMLYFGMPAAFVETTDIWLEPRRARLAVTWAGPFTGLILAGAAAIFMFMVPEAPVNGLLFKMAGFAYITVFFNINPLLKLDGYYLLTDAVDITSLRERSLSFVRQRFTRKLIGRERFSRDELIFTVFGLLSLLWTLYAIYTAVFFWQTRIAESVRVMLSSSVPLVTRFINLLIVAAIGSFIFLISIQLFKTARGMVMRFSRSGNLENYRRLAFILGGIALVLGVGLPLLIEEFAVQVSAGMGLLAALACALWLLKSSQNYIGSLRGVAFLAFFTGIILSGLALLANVWPELSSAYPWIQWAALLAITVGFASISWSTLNWKTALIGAAAGIIWFAALELGLGPPVTMVFTGLSAFTMAAGIWAVRQLRGSARTPAIMLFLLGGLFLVLSWMFPEFSLSLALAGSLLFSAGGIHLSNAKLPRLSSPGEVEITSDTRWAIGVSVGILIRRVIAQVFFESGFAGVERLGQSFGRSIHKHGVDIKIVGNVFYDNELPNRTTDELVEVYGLVFDILHDYICKEYGDRMGKLTIGFGIDLLPWEYHEVVSELILSRRHWGLSLNQEISDVKEKRLALLKRISLFSALSEQEMDDLATALREEHFATGEFVLRQGDAGDKFYIIQHGVATVWQKTPDETEKNVDKLGVAQYFGEVALISNAPRNASIRAQTPLTVLSLNRNTFDRLVKKCINLGKQVSARVGNSWILRGMPIFDELSSDDIDQLASRLEAEKIPANTVLFHEGDYGDKFYIVATGLLSVTHQVNGKEIEISRRGPGEYLGEIALIENRPRTATVTALEETELLSLKAEYFQEALANFMQVSKTLTLTGSRRLQMTEKVSAELTPT